jgi:DNA-binding MarR family transcriptional regulator
MSSPSNDTPVRAPAPNLGLLLREPFRIGSERLHERFAERGHPEVRAPHGNVLQFLDPDGTRVSALAQRAQITKQSMAELVAHLERHGYVERIPDPTDRRAKLVRATARGQEVYALAREFVAELDDEWGRRLGTAKMRELRTLLEELNDVVAAWDSDADQRRHSVSRAPARLR